MSEPALCPNCGTATATRFCGACGQKRMEEDEYSLAHFLGHALHDFTHFDTRYFRTIKTLFLNPGRATADWLDGKRGRYMAPLSLFIITNVLFFLVVHFSNLNVFSTPLEVHEHMMVYSRIVDPIVHNHLLKTHGSHAVYAARFDEITGHQAKSLVIIMIPMFSAFTFLLWHRARKYYVQHLVYGLHFFTAFMLSVFTIAPVAYFLVFLIMSGIGIKVTDSDLFYSAVFSLMMWSYLYISARKAFGSRPLPALGKSLVMTLCFWLVIVPLYRFILFFSVFLVA